MANNEAGVVDRYVRQLHLGVGGLVAPLTSSLVTLQAGRGENTPDLLFRSVSDRKLHHFREFDGKVVLLNLWAT